MNNTLKGYVGFKGEKGDSAYEVAVKNGYIGTEQDWLANLGTSSHFDIYSVIYDIEEAELTILPLPDAYTNNSFVDLYANGKRLNSNEYTIEPYDPNNHTIDFVNNIGNINLTKPLDIGTTLEIIILTMLTNTLPISETISSSSNNSTASGTKAVYDFVNTQNEAKLNNSDIQVVTGSIVNIPAGETLTTDIAYPTGFTKSNTNIIGKMVSSNSNYYDTSDETITASGFPIIEMIALIDTGIRVWLKNTNSNTTRNGYFKITLLKK